MFAVSSPVGRLGELFRIDELEICRAICAVRDEILVLLADDCVIAEKVEEGPALVGLGLASVDSAAVRCCSAMAGAVSGRYRDCDNEKDLRLLGRSEARRMRREDMRQVLYYRNIKTQKELPVISTLQGIILQE
jgi:hypothetical protein